MRIDFEVLGGVPVVIHSEIESVGVSSEGVGIDVVGEKGFGGVFLTFDELRSVLQFPGVGDMLDAA